MHQISFGGRAPPEPPGGLKRSPYPLEWPGENERITERRERGDEENEEREGKEKRENGIGAAHSEKFTKVDAYDHHHLFVHKTV